MSNAEKSRRQALNEASAQEMRRDPRVIVIGEDVAAAPVRTASAMLMAGSSV